MQISEHSPAIPHAILAGFGGQQGVSLKSLFASTRREILKPGEAAFWEGDTASHVFLVAEGCLRLSRILPDGRRAVTGFAFTGELVALWMPGFHTETAEAITEVRLHRLTQAKFQAAVDASDDLRPQLLARICEKMSATQRHLVVLGQLTAEERVAHFLTTLARRTEADRTRPIIVELPMTRLDIADYLGLTIETVCRVISKFKRDGLLELRGRHSLILKRMTKLQLLAGGIDPDEAAARAPVRPTPAAPLH